MYELKNDQLEEHNVYETNNEIITDNDLEDKEIKLSQLFSGPFTILLCFASMGLIMGLVFMPPQMFFTKHFL